MTTMRERLLTSPLPVDRVAARVVKKAKPESLWAPAVNYHQQHVHSKNVLPTKPLPFNAPADILRVVGQRRGRMKVIGYAANQGSQNKSARWVVRCDCGNYEQRTGILRWLSKPEGDQCCECHKRQWLLGKTA